MMERERGESEYFGIDFYITNNIIDEKAYFCLFTMHYFIVLVTLIFLQDRGN